MTDGRFRAMSGIRHHIVRQCKQLGPYGFEELFIGTARQIGTADRIREKRIAGNNLFFHLQVETATARCMPRRVQNGHVLLAEGYFHAIVKECVRLGRILSQNTVPPGNIGSAAQQGNISGMDQ